MTYDDLDKKHGLEPGTSLEMGRAMSRCWGAISCDLPEGIEKEYKQKGERRNAHAHLWEARCVAENTIDADRLMMYGFEGAVPEWYKAMMDRCMKGEFQVIEYGEEVWLAERTR